MARILVIDDDPDVRSVIEEMLEPAGHEVLFAVNGHEGLEAHRGCPADLVVTDLFMPDKDGIETIHDLVQQFPEVKIIAMSGGARLLDGEGYLSMASTLGADAVLRKPFAAGTLLEAIDALLQNPGAGWTRAGRTSP